MLFALGLIVGIVIGMIISTLIFRALYYKDDDL
jgi:uncharacterized membrane-anchored protein YhcB (DUF1043 family)